MVKIGLTKNTTTKRRMKELNGTNVPGRFTSRCEVKVKNVKRTEETIHSLLAEYRIDSAREFYGVSGEQEPAVFQRFLDKVDRIFDLISLQNSEEVAAVPVAAASLVVNDAALKIPPTDMATSSKKGQAWKSSWVRNDASESKLKQALSMMSSEEEDVGPIIVEINPRTGKPYSMKPGSIRARMNYRKNPAAQKRRTEKYLKAKKERQMQFELSRQTQSV